MNVNFENILTYLTLVTGALYAVHFFMARKEQAPQWLQTLASFFPIFLFVLVFRSFLIEPFRIPSGSLEPTLQVGDFVLVNKFTYGIRLPMLHSKIVKLGDPKTGDVAVFRWPPAPHIDYIKRIIGVPGDRVVYKDKQLIINGVPVTQTFQRYETERDSAGHLNKVEVRQENLSGHRYSIYVRPDVVTRDFDVTVPPGHYFAMGDNRDDSADSRFWGFVPEQNLVGRAFGIWFSWDNLTSTVRWTRIGASIK